MNITYTCAPGGAPVLVPGGLVTPYGATAAPDFDGGTARAVVEAATGQTAWLVEAAQDLTVTWTMTTDAAPYPDAMFRPHDSRFTRTADALVAEAREMAGDLRGVARATAIARAVAERFTYGHPEARFTDGLDAVPAIGCGLTEGSCVDINTYFIAALRAAGIEAGYVTGYFMPEEKGDHCEDGHCWVVTRIDGATHEWDVAHHLKMGTRAVAPGLNPKPGWRAGVFHSMGLTFPDLDIHDLKALIEPLIIDGPPRGFDAPAIRLVA